MPLDLSTLRAEFPALERYPNVVFFDNPGGTQIARQAIEQINQYLVQHNANRGGAFRSSRDSDFVLDEARRAAAEFFNAAYPEEIIFGNNMTTLTFHISRSLAHLWQPGDTIAVTRLDHDANITPWVLAAEARGVSVEWVDFDPETGLLDLEDLQRVLVQRPRLLAIGYASNALGTINPIRKIVNWAHANGTLVYVDAVQYAAHAPIDVQMLGCDFLVVSSYKFFGPHAAMLYGRRDLLESLFAYKVRPASPNPPGKFETGTQNHEGIAGILGALEYLAWVGETFGTEYQAHYPQLSGRALHLKTGMEAVRAYEFEISRAVLTTLQQIPGLRLYGPADVRHLEQRVPTFAFTLQNWHPKQLAQALAAREIYVWSGNYYALAVTERLGLEQSGGMLRVGPVHYNTRHEIDLLHQALLDLAKMPRVE
ncbi:MAG: cysteine desulfurase-like protein [Anaerolineales bacterium]